MQIEDIYDTNVNNLDETCKFKIDSNTLSKMRSIVSDVLFTIYNDNLRNNSKIVSNKVKEFKRLNLELAQETANISGVNQSVMADLIGIQNENETLQAERSKLINRQEELEQELVF